MIFLGKIYKKSILKIKYLLTKVDKGKPFERMGRKVMGLRQTIAMTARPPAFFVFV